MISPAWAHKSLPDQASLRLRYGIMWCWRQVKVFELEGKEPLNTQPGLSIPRELLFLSQFSTATTQPLLTLYCSAPGKHTPLTVFPDASAKGQQLTASYALLHRLRQAHFPELLRDPASLVLLPIWFPIPPEEGYQELDQEDEAIAGSDVDVARFS